jgi:hypothetical protein
MSRRAYSAHVSPAGVVTVSQPEDPLDRTTARLATVAAALQTNDPAIPGVLVSIDSSISNATAQQLLRAIANELE